MVLGVAVLAALSNVSRLEDAAHGLEGIAQQQRGGLAALEVARDRVSPDLELTQDNSGVDYLGLLDASSYLSAVDAFGSPAYTADELRSAPEGGQVAADRVSALALRIGLAPAAGAVGTDCLTVHPSVSPTVFPVPSKGLLLRADSSGNQVALRRFASQTFPVVLGALPRGTERLLRIPPDGSPQPWTAELTGGGTVLTCQAG